jgi:hypothetical protein
MTREKMPLIIVKKRFFDAFCAGTKTIEYRRHRRPFVASTFYPGRIVRLVYNYDIRRYPGRLARVDGFVVRSAGACPDLSGVYPGLDPADEIALITLALLPE